MKSLIRYLQISLQESGERCCTSTSRDWKTIAARYEHEGDSFLGITLPAFGADLQRALSQSQVTPDLFAGFQRRGSLPLFLGGFMEQVFDRSSGRLLDEPSIDAILEIRQITLACSKIELPATERRKNAAFASFIQCEEDVRENDKHIDSDSLTRFKRLARLIWGETLCDIDREIDNHGVVPRHGPGGTADRLRGNSKWNLRSWPQRLDRMFPMGDYLLPSLRYHASLSAVQSSLPGDERPVRVVDVPKTLKTPRIIALEPTCMQYVQQGILREVVGAVERSTIARQFISWQSQDENQDLARVGSKYCRLATLDLSEASDRVSNQHVRLLLQPHPTVFEAVDAARSRKADVPGHGVIRLAKFASMGSALTFPFEAMVFCTIIFVGIERELNRPLTRREINSFRGKVRVYGDDIIVPVEFVLSVVESLETFGLKVNSRKSFWTGKFRESCGKEYYDGHDVTICRVRDPFPSHRRDAVEMNSLINLRNQCYFAGRWKSVRFLDSLVEGMKVPFPIVESSSPLTARHSFLSWKAEAVDPDTQAPLVKGLKLRSVLPSNEVDDIGALLKCMIRLELREKSRSRDDSSPFRVTSILDLPVEDDQHLMRSGRPEVVDIKPQWGSPF